MPPTTLVRKWTRMLCDGGGLYLVVSPGDGDDSIRRSWIFRYATPEKVISKGGRQRQRERQMGLGPLHTVSLADARDKARECRKLLLEGIDPLEFHRGRKSARKTARAKAAMTFDQARDAYVLDHGDRWKNAHYARQWVKSLQDYATPVFGKVPVAAVDEELVIKTLRPIWKTMPHTAGRIRGRIESILDWARVQKMRDGENPARWKGHLGHVFAKRSDLRPVKPMAALPFQEMATFMTKLRANPGKAARGLELLILTATRTSEVLKARWSEIDTETATWNIPAAHTKTRKSFQVPLSDAAVILLNQLNRGNPEERIFKMGAGKMLQVCKSLRSDISVHGTARATFRTWAAEMTDFPNEVCEMALGHAVSNQVEAAYRRGTMFEKRKLLMQKWADYCAGQTEEVAGN